MASDHHRELDDHRSPFASGRAVAGTAASAATSAVEDTTTASATAAGDADQIASLAWAEAWEEAVEAPCIAAAYSSTLSAYVLAQQQVVEPAEAEGLKAADAACALPAWRCEVAQLLALALPIAVSGRKEGCSQGGMYGAVPPSARSHVHLASGHRNGRCVATMVSSSLILSRARSTPAFHPGR